MRDRVERAGTGLRRGAASLLSPTGLRGAAVEVTWVAAHAALYPLGVVKERAGGPRRGAPRPGRALAAAARPGRRRRRGLRARRSCWCTAWSTTGRSSPSCGAGCGGAASGRVLAINYSPLTSDVRLAATNLATRVEQICAETGFERIHLIGHSMGGLVARYYVQRLDGDARVHTLVTLGTPHGGTKAARLVPHRLARQLRPGQRAGRRAVRARARLPHPVPGRLERPRPDDGAQARRRGSTTPTWTRATCSSGASGTCRCRSTGRPCTRSG